MHFKTEYFLKTRMRRKDRPVPLQYNMRTIDTLLHRGELPLFTENTLKHKSQLNTRREVMFLNQCSALILGADHGEGILTNPAQKYP